MRHATAAALYGLSVDAFIEGIADEAPVPSQFGLNAEQAQQVRTERYADKLRAQRSGKKAA